MNLHALVSGSVAAVNPHVTVSVQVSTGSTVQADGTRVPTYAAAVDVPAQVQPLSFRDLQQMDSLNISGTRKAFYLYGRVDGLVRDERKGGDLITMADGTVWLVALISEQWYEGATAAWCKALATLQNESA